MPMKTYGGVEEMYAGQVIALRERYAGCERDVFEALVPDGEGGFRWQEYNSCNSFNGQQDFAGKAEIDAPEALKAEAKAWLAEKDRRDREAAYLRQSAIEELRPEVGKDARVVRGRKVAQGTEGVIIWVGAGKWGERIGLKDAKGEVFWTALGNVEVIL